MHEASKDLPMTTPRSVKLEKPEWVRWIFHGFGEGRNVEINDLGMRRPSNIVTRPRSRGDDGHEYKNNAASNQHRALRILKKDKLC